ncbi:hypothetical protein GCM10009113_13120 [Marinobacter szutsaonensis]
MSICMIAGIALVAHAWADVSHSGSFKNLSVGSRSMIDGHFYFSNLSRLRLEPRFRHGDWRLDAAYDFESVAGSVLDSPEFALLRDSPDPRYWDLQGTVYSSGDLVARHQLYRGTVQWRSPVGDWRLGRQQVNWSTALIWNPTDILNPVTPTSLEPDERIGVDALLWDRPWGALGRISAAYAPQHRNVDSSMAVRIKRYFIGVDTGLMVGEFAEVTKAGFSGSGSVASTGWRTEIVWSDPRTGNNYWQGVADLNWAFPSGFNLAVEYFYNGQHEPQAGVDLVRLLSAHPIYSGRHYAGLLAWQDITAFWQYRVVAVRNADDASWVLYPRSTWTLPLEPEIYLTAGAQWFGGDDDSEYGRFEPVGLMEVQWFF